MGTADYLRCQMPLPEPRPAEDTVFLTRDTEIQFCEDHTITPDGRLIYHPGGFRGPDDEPPDPVIFGPDEEVPFNGDLAFYDSGLDGRSYHYVACFVDGRCLRILTKETHRALMEQGRRWALGLPVGDQPKPPISSEAFTDALIQARQEAAAEAIARRHAAGQPVYATDDEGHLCEVSPDGQKRKLSPAGIDALTR